jgi:hypothetical protein
MELSFQKELKPRPPRVKRREDVSQKLRSEAEEIPKQEVDDFSKTYTAEDKKQQANVTFLHHSFKKVCQREPQLLPF